MSDADTVLEIEGECRRQILCNGCCRTNVVFVQLSIAPILIGKRP